MSRVGLFVDAGYLLAVGAVLRTGQPGRSRVLCDYPGVIASLIEWTKTHSRAELLRTYWYDAARDAVPTTDQLVIGRLPEVKLRLGRLHGNKQKGVDSLIVRDLMTLARERAIATAYLLSGDEDIREGVIAAQDLGVRVVVLGLPSDQPGQGQADTLIREADLHLELHGDLWQPFFTAALTPVQALLIVTPLEAAAAEEQGMAPVRVDTAEPTPEILACLSAEGEAFAAQCLQRLSPEVVRLVRSQRPVIPSDLDADLLRRASDRCGDLTPFEHRRALRRSFWQAIFAEVPHRVDEQS